MRRRCWAILLVALATACTSNRTVLIENGDRAAGREHYDVAIENYRKALRESSNDAERQEVQAKLDATDRALAK